MKRNIFIYAACEAALVAIVIDLGIIGAPMDLLVTLLLGGSIPVVLLLITNILELREKRNHRAGRHHRPVPDLRKGTDEAA